MLKSEFGPNVRIEPKKNSELQISLFTLESSPTFTSTLPGI